jgi:glycosyltransferase involved in cell wall biosynthesis
MTLPATQIRPRGETRHDAARLVEKRRNNVRPLWVSTSGRDASSVTSGTGLLTFSIVIPAYNYGRFVGRAIDSALGQDGDDFEVLVLDDGSTDDTRDVVAAYGDRVRYFHHENRGQAATRNRGIDLSTGRYLIFLDADDRLLPGALTPLRQAVEEDPSLGMVFGRHFSVCEQGIRRPGKLHPEMRSPMRNFRDFLNRKFGICNGTAAVRRDVFEKIRYPEHIRNGEDLPVFAATLLHFPCRSISETVLEVHAHQGRVRNNIDAIRHTAEQVIDELFDPEHMPPKALRYRSLFAARKFFSMARSFYRSGNYLESRQFYRKGVATQWTCLLNFTASFRYLKTFVRQGLSLVGADSRSR